MAAVAPSFSAVDYLVFSASLLVSLGIGLYYWYHGRGQGTREFFLGGGSMAPLPVVLSFMTGVVSALSILGNSAEMYYFGSQLWTNALGMALGTALCLSVVVPVLYPLRLITLFEYLELRWGSNLVQRVATGLQLLHMTTFTGIALYAPSLAISFVTPISSSASVVVMGVVCSIYASMGGAKAVVYTDAFQSVVMVAGVVMVLVKGCSDVGGVTSSWAIDDLHGRIEFFNLDPSPLERHTLLTTTVFGVFFALSVVGLSQAQYQRWVSVSTISQSYLVVAAGAVGVVALWSLIHWAGLVVFSVYAECDPLTAGYIEKSDQILMYFVADKLGSIPGVPGLFVAAVYSGVLSTVSSSINSLAAMVWKDLMQPLDAFAKTSDEKAKNINIVISVCVGGAAVMVGLLAGSITSLVQVSYALGGALAGPLTGIFVTAICCPWVKLWSVLLGCTVALALDLWMVFGSFLYAPPLEMLPLSTAGCENLNTTLSTASLVATTARDEVFPLYRVSYCLYGAVGVLTTVGMSTVFSCFFGLSY